MMIKKIIPFAMLGACLGTINVWAAEPANSTANTKKLGGAETSQTHSTIQDDNLKRLYEQASEVSGLVTQYVQDLNAVQYVYGPIPASSAVRSFPSTGAFAPIQLNRMMEVNEQYLKTLAQQPFDAFSIHGQVDYLMLKNKIERHQTSLKTHQQQYQKIADKIPLRKRFMTLKPKEDGENR
jgi:hypothetical protein